MANIPKGHRKPWDQPGGKHHHNDPDDDMAKPFASARRYDEHFYKTYAWTKLRNQYIQQNPYCELCAKRNITVEAKFVDHITARQDGGESLDWNNLQSLCRPCHQRKSNQEQARRKP